MRFKFKNGTTLNKYFKAGIHIYIRIVQNVHLQIEA